jgi:hypothetical protein
MAQVNHPMLSPDAEVPTEPHLAVVERLEGHEQMVSAIQVGCLMYMILDPKNREKIIPMILAKVNYNNITFLCGCMRPGCTRKITFRGQWKGRHNTGDKGEIPVP